MELSDVRWRRVTAFALGLGLVGLYTWLDPFEYLAAPVAAALASVPVTMCLYGATERPWKSALAVGAAVAIGLGVGTFLEGTVLAARALPVGP